MGEAGQHGNTPGQATARHEEGSPAWLLFQLTPSLLWIVDRELRFTFSAGAGLTALAAQPGEVVGMSLFEYFHTDSTTFKPIAAHLRALEGESVDYDVTWRGRIYRSHVEPLRDAGGNIIGCLGAALDITELQRLDEERAQLLADTRAARAAAEEERTRWSFLAEAGRQLASSLDYEATLQQVAHLAVPKLADICMVALPDARGHLRPVALALLDPTQEALARRFMRRYPWISEAPTGMRIAMETRQPRLYPHISDEMLAAAAQDAEHLEVLRALKMTSGLLVPLTAHGRTLGVLTLVMGPSGRRLSAREQPLAEELASRCAFAVESAQLYRQAQEALRHRDESLAQLDTFLRTAPFGLAFLDTGLRYVRMNDALAAMNGVSAGQSLGKHIREVLPAQLADQVEPTLRQVLESGESIVGREISIAMPPGSEKVRHWLASYYPVRTEAGQLLGVGGVVVDITERKRADDERAHLYRDAQDAIRVRDDFLSIASHELKTPLTPLSLRLQSLEKALERGEKVGPEAVRQARRHLDKLTTLINDLLDVSRIQSGRLVLHPEPMPLRPLLREVVAALRPTRGMHELLLSEPAEEVMVRADRARLEQVFLNLVDNALKYSPNGGQIRVELTAQGSEAMVAVSDHGIGIPREQQERLFERYFRARNSTRSYGGLGLGLYICRDIVERQGGRIEVESEEGRGSTFRVRLPLWRD